MTDLINQITINGQTTTYLGYRNPVENSVLYDFRQGLINIFTQQFGNTNTRFLSHDKFYFKFPSSFETMPSVAMATNGTSAATGWRFAIGTGGGNISFYANSNNGNGITSVQLAGFTGNWNNQPGTRYMFAVVNNQSVVYAHFGDINNTSLFWWGYLGWARNGQYLAANTPRNCVQAANGPSFSRVLTENLTTSTNLTVQGPAISCSVATTGANSTEVIIRDSTSPNNYIGQLWNMIRLPSSCVLGKIYKNTGVDPDTDVVETDQKAFWLCVGDWGTDKIGMRVWTEDLL